MPEPWAHDEQVLSTMLFCLLLRVNKRGRHSGSNDYDPYSRRPSRPQPILLVFASFILCPVTETVTSSSLILLLLSRGYRPCCSRSRLFFVQQITRFHTLRHACYGFDFWPGNPLLGQPCHGPGLWPKRSSYRQSMRNGHVQRRPCL